MKNIIFWTPGKFKFIKFTWQNYRPPTHTQTFKKNSGSAFVNKQWLFTQGLIDN